MVAWLDAAYGRPPSRYSAATGTSTVPLAPSAGTVTIQLASSTSPAASVFAVTEAPSIAHPSGTVGVTTTCRTSRSSTENAAVSSNVEPGCTCPSAGSTWRVAAGAGSTGSRHVSRPGFATQ